MSALFESSIEPVTARAAPGRLWLLLAWVLFWILFLLGVGQSQGWLPLMLAAGAGQQLGLAVSAALLLLALAVQAWQTRRELPAVQAQELAAEVERQVAARTAELQQAKLAAEQANDAKTRFFSNLSHDLRAPLNALVGLSQSLWLECRGREMPAEFLTFLEQIRQSGLYLNQLMDNILDLAAIEAGHDRVRLARFPVREWFHRCRDIVAPIASQAAVRMEWSCAADDVRLFGSDPLKLSQCLLNLALNAVKFTPHGGDVRIALTLAETGLVITVADNGPGIPDAVREQVFERFMQVPGEPRTPGNGVGLGLHIVKHHTEALGGTIRVENRAAGGAVFTLAVPDGGLRGDP